MDRKERVKEYCFACNVEREGMTDIPFMPKHICDVENVNFLDVYKPWSDYYNHIMFNLEKLILKELNENRYAK